MTCDIIIFSKDRPLQLDMLLVSIRSNIIGSFVVHVLFKASITGSREAYIQLRDDHPSVNFIPEEYFYSDVITLVSNPIYDRVMFLVDDSIFLREVDIDSVGSYMENYPKVIGFSLRLGNNTTRCHTQRVPQKLPPRMKTIHNNGDSIMMWLWGECEHDFGYPLELSSSIYQKSFISSIIRMVDKFNTPNTLEVVMDNMKTNIMRDVPMLMSYTVSHVVSLPINLTQTVFHNRNQCNEMGRQDFGIRPLMKRYTKGQRLDHAKMCLSIGVPTGAHNFIKELIFI